MFRCYYENGIVEYSDLRFQLQYCKILQDLKLKFIAAQVIEAKKIYLSCGTPAVHEYYWLFKWRSDKCFNIKECFDITIKVMPKEEWLLRIIFCSEESTETYWAPWRLHTLCILCSVLVEHDSYAVQKVS